MTESKIAVFAKRPVEVFVSEGKNVSETLALLKETKMGLENVGEERQEARLGPLT